MAEVLIPSHSEWCGGSRARGERRNITGGWGMNGKRESSFRGLVSGQVVLITGGGSGIGRATALLCAWEGAKAVGIADVQAATGKETVQKIQNLGVESMFMKIDVSKSVDVMVMVDEMVKQYGRLDAAFNNAGIESADLPTVAESEKDWDQVLAVNLKSIWLCMKREIPQMVGQGGGSIVNTASVAGLVGFQREPAYVASKHGVVGLTKAAALEYAKAGVRVNCVCPGMIRTPMINRVIQGRPEVEARLVAGEPIGRLGTAEEVAEVMVWLCSSRASFVTGHALAVDGGWMAQGDHGKLPIGENHRVLVGVP